MADANIVTLSVSSYNQLKNETIRCQLFLSNVLGAARLSPNHQKLEFDSDKIAEAINFCYQETYKKKLSALKTQAARYGERNGVYNND